MKKIKITEPVFDTELNIIITQDRGEFKKYAKKLGWDDPDKVWIADGYCDTANKEGIVWLLEYKDTPKDKCTLIHELAHVTVRFFETMGIETTTENSEPFAYYMGFLTREFYKKWKK